MIELNTFKKVIKSSKRRKIAFITQSVIKLMIINIVRIWTFSNKLVGSVVSFWANESDIKTEKFLSDKSLKILKDLLVISFEWFFFEKI